MGGFVQAWLGLGTPQTRLKIHWEDTPAKVVSFFFFFNIYIWGFLVIIIIFVIVISPIQFFSYYTAW